MLYQPVRVPMNSNQITQRTLRRKSVMREGITFLLSFAGVFATSMACAQVTFLGDWTDFGSQFKVGASSTTYLDGQPVAWSAGYGAHHWRVVMEKAIDRLTVAQDPTSPQGGAVLQVQVLPGDSTGFTGERAEVISMNDPTGTTYPVTVNTPHEVYGISIKLDPHWQPPLHDATHSNTWGLFMQLHSPNEFESPPAFAFAADTSFHIDTLGGNLIDANGRRKNGNSVPLSNGDLRAGHWVQFIIDAVWAYDSSGSLTIYRKDEGDTAFTKVLTLSGQPTLQYDSQFSNSQNVDPSNGSTYLHYWRAGYYRSDSPGVTTRLSLGPIVRGTTIQEVEAAAFRPSLIPMAPIGVTLEN
jgi:hypothetical protein